ncbi:MAG: hypothetical protein EAZ85_01990 [Bacteroidetes bacterium]|nr:MAG: hypothetical protein EAZ85_01990 [Bacteroidota bacterium]
MSQIVKSSTLTTATSPTATSPTATLITAISNKVQNFVRVDNNFEKKKIFSGNFQLSMSKT